MIRFAYPNVEGNDFVGCGRFLTTGPEDSELNAGYEIADPRTSRLSEIITAASILAKESFDTPREVYEYKDRAHPPYQGDSLGLAYLLANIARSRLPRWHRSDAPLDIWCTGAIETVGDHPKLKSVFPNLFEIKLQAFLQDERSIFFIVPVANLKPKHTQLLRQQGAHLMSLSQFHPLSKDFFQAKHVLQLHGNELETFVELFFEKPSAPILSPSISQFSDVCPYKGLSAFTEQDAEWFFGREALVQRLWQHYQALRPSTAPATSPRLFTVLGPSGTGKSSVVLAGLIPLLKKQQSHVLVFTPGEHPIETLATLLAKCITYDSAPVAKIREFAEEMSRPNTGNEWDGLRRIGDLVSQHLAAPLVLIIDQFEEIYSLCESSDERDRFINNLLNAVSEADSRLSALLTLRSDFLRQTQQHPVLNQLIASQSLIVPMMNKEELRLAIAEPAKRAGSPLDHSTIDLLIAETIGRDGALPLLEFALTCIWSELTQGESPNETWRKIGGLGGRLAKEAQYIYDGLSEADRKIARRLFLSLIHLGEGARDTRRRVLLADMSAQGETLVRIQFVAQQFSRPEARLITLSSDRQGREIAEITHEALFDHWQLLRDWLEASRDDLRFARRLEDAARHWQEHQCPKGLLWRSPDIERLHQFYQHAAAPINNLQSEFYHASMTAYKKTQRRRFMAFTVIIPIAFLAIILVQNTMTQLREKRMLEKFWHKEQELRQAAETRAASTALSSHLELEALLASLNAALIVQTSDAPWKTPEIQKHVTFTLQQVLDSVRERNRLEGHENGTASFAFHPEGQLLASVGNDGTIMLRDWQGVFRGTLEKPDTKKNTGWDLPNQLEQNFARVPHSKQFSLAFSPDGKLLALGGHDEEISIWNPHTKELISQLRSGHGAIYSLEFSPDNAMLATGNADGTITLWKRHSKTGMFTEQMFDLLSPPKDTSENVNQSEDVGILDLSFSPDGYVLATAGADNRVRLWDVRRQTLLETLQGHQARVTGVRFCPDGQRFVSGSADGTIRIWRRNGTSLKTLDDQYGVLDVGFSSEGLIVSANIGREIKLWNQNGRLLETFSGHRQDIYEVTFSPDGQSITSASRDGTVRFWSVMPSEPRRLELYDGVNDVAFSPDGESFVSVDDGKVAKVWRRDGTLVASLTGHAGPVWCAAFSPDGALIATGGADADIRFWTPDGEPIGQLTDHKDAVTDLSFSTDSQWLVSTSKDKTVIIWQRSKENEFILQHTLTGHENAVWKICLDPDKQTIMSAGEDNTLRWWDFQGKLQHELPLSTPISSLTYSPNGKYFAVAGKDHLIRIFSADSDIPKAILKGHQDWITDIIFHPESRLIASASLDNTIKLWSLNGELLRTLRGHHDLVRSLAFSPDGKTLISAGHDGALLLWPLERSLEELTRKACHLIEDYLYSSSDNHDDTLCDGIAPDWFAEGEMQVRNGDLSKATASFQQAAEQYPELKLHPQETAQTFTAQALLKKGVRLVTQRKVQEAMAAVTKAQKLDPTLPVSDQVWNRLCWQGSLLGYPDPKAVNAVLPACEKSVFLDSTEGYHLDSRALAKALSGDRHGAIDDFKEFLSWLKQTLQQPNIDSDEAVALRKIQQERTSWLEILEDDRNPFTPREINRLLLETL